MNALPVLRIADYWLQLEPLQTLATRLKVQVRKARMLSNQVYTSSETHCSKNSYWC
jgi:hypothetical protein